MLPGKPLFPVPGDFGDNEEAGEQVARTVQGRFNEAQRGGERPEGVLAAQTSPWVTRRGFPMCGYERMAAPAWEGTEISGTMAKNVALARDARAFVRCQSVPQSCEPNHAQ